MDQKLPPKWIRKFLGLFLDPRILEASLGDLEEKFQVNLRNNRSLWKVNTLYVIEGLGFIKMARVRKNVFKNLNNYGMYKNYLKIAFRNLAKSKLFSVINICGMAVSAATVIVIALFIYDELAFDKHVEDYALKYRLYTVGSADDGSLRNRSMIAPMIAPTAATEFPEVESFARFLNLNYPVLFKVGGKKLTERKGGYADPAILNFFSLTVSEGDASFALKEPSTISNKKNPLIT